MTEKEKVINIALGEVGYREKETNSNLDDKTANAGDENYTKYARDLDNVAGFYNGKKNGYDWCDIFVDWCFVKALGAERAMQLLNQPEKSGGAGCGVSMSYFEKIERLFKSPSLGDQIFFTDGESIYHTGLVYDVDDTKVYTVEGNTNGGQVAKKSYPLGASYIRGYGRPLWNESANIEDREEEPAKETKVDTIKVTAKEGLNIRKEPNTECSILGAYVYNTSKDIYEIKGNWGRTQDGWICLDYTDYSKSTNTSNTTSTKKYTTGRYIVNTEVLTVRKGPGTNYDWLRYSELTSNAQSQVYSKCGYKPNGLCAGVICDVSEIKGKWGKIPSGWICLDYCKKQ
jgi:hypothetical protein